MRWPREGEEGFGFMKPLGRKGRAAEKMKRCQLTLVAAAVVVQH